MDPLPHSAAGTARWEDFIELPDDDRRELFEGELVEAEVPTTKHEWIVSLLVQLLGAWVRTRKAGLVLASGYKVRVDERRGVMPDLMFIRAGRVDMTADFKGLASVAPDLVVEVISPGSSRKDRVQKLRYYAQRGVPEYWIVDALEDTFERLVLAHGQYVIADALEGDAVFKPASFPELEISLAELWTVPQE